MSNEGDEGTENPDAVEPDAVEPKAADTGHSDAPEPDQPDRSGYTVTLDEIRKDAERQAETFERMNASVQQWAKGSALNDELLEGFRKAINPLAGKNFNYLNPGTLGVMQGITGAKFLANISPNIDIAGITGMRASSAIANMLTDQLDMTKQFRSAFPSDQILRTLQSLYHQRHEMGRFLGSANQPRLATSTYTFLTTTEDLKYTSDRSVWHYTSGYVLMQVLQHNYLWASSRQFLNDSSEVTHGIEIIEDAFERAIGVLKEEGTTDRTLAKIQEVQSMVLDEDYIETVINEIYLISGSSRDDSLTLWRNYAKGDGFAIGIDAGVDLSPDGYVLDPDDEDTDIREDVPPISGWYKVHYSKQEKQKLADDFVSSAIEDIKRTEYVHLPVLVDELRKQTLILASTMKHKAFEDEREVRWMSTNWIPLDGVVDVVHYEHARNTIVPVLHIKTSSDEPKPLPLRGVRCSPVTPDGIVRTVEGLLKQRGYRKASKNVRKSNQPYRG